MAKEKVSAWLEDGLLDSLMEKHEINNKSEAIRMAVLESVTGKDNLKRISTLFPYIGKKPLRIGREVVEAFKQSWCNVFIDLFCGSLAMLHYLPVDVKVVVNDIDGNLTNLYKVIKSHTSEFVSKIMKLPYSEGQLHEFNRLLSGDSKLSDMDRAVTYNYVRFAVYRGKMDNSTFRISAKADSNMALDYQKNLNRIIALSKRFQTVEILNRDFRRVLRVFDSEEILVYSDFPYGIMERLRPPLRLES